MNFVIESKVGRLVVLTCSLLVAPYAPAMADSNEVEMEAKLTPCATPCVTVPGAKGELEYEQEFLSDGVTLKEVELEAVVKIPVPNVLGITATTGGTVVQLDLTRLNPLSQLAEPYATCIMVLKKGKPTSLTYALKVSGKLKNGQLVAGKKPLGTCDTDLLTANVQSGIPAIQDGDAAFVSVNGTDILSSVLGSDDDDDDDDDD